MSDENVAVEITNWGFQDYKPGDRADVEPHVARDLIHSGHAVPANKTAAQELNVEFPAEAKKKS